MEISRAEMSQRHCLGLSGTEELSIQRGFDLLGSVSRHLQLGGVREDIPGCDSSTRHHNREVVTLLHRFLGNLWKNLGVNAVLDLTVNMWIPHFRCLWAGWEVCDKGTATGHQSLFVILEQPCWEDTLRRNCSYACRQL